MVSNQILIFFSVLKFLAVESISCRKFRNTVEKEELINLLLIHWCQCISTLADKALVCGPKFNLTDINISLGKSKQYLKRRTVPSFHKIKRKSSARERIPLEIRGTLETSEEGWDPWR